MVTAAKGVLVALAAATYAMTSAAAATAARRLAVAHESAM